MNIMLYNYARSFIIIFNNGEHEYDAPYPFSDINEALAYAEEEIDNRQQAILAHIIDAETGELYVTCSWDDESIPEEDYGDWDYNEDEGFDPYIGQYTWDC